MKNLLDHDNLICTMFLLNNPKTNKPELVVHFSNFENERDALNFASTFKEDTELHTDIFPDISETIH
tara:strand:- start:422 stop:622 length:201 start_codon:yes stop_codon:yes gene_type:complete